MAGLTLYEKLDQIEHRYVEMTTKLSSPEFLTIRRIYQKLARRHSDFRDGGKYPSGKAARQKV